MAYTLNWGIIGAGGISAKFAKDCIVDPATRDVSDVSHKILAVASRDASKAQAFIDKQCTGASYKTNIKALGSYEALVADQDVQAVYIGTPHSHHYENTKLCLIAGKHVLCEKPMTVNAKQAEELFVLAREKNLFLMEALWTRFFPITYDLQRVIASGEIGEVVQVVANLSIDFVPDQLDPGHRMTDPNLAGGAMLDLGPYPWTHIALSVLHQQIKPAGSPFSGDGPPDPKKPKVPGHAQPLDPPLEVPKIVASVVPYRHPKAKPGSPAVDQSTIATLEFPTPSGHVAQATFIASMRTATPKSHAVDILGTKGSIRFPSPPYRPERFFVTKWDSVQDVADEKPPAVEDREHHVPIPGGGTWGFVWQTDEVARCIAAGRIESTRMPHRETILMMKVFDEMRRQGGITYPPSIESTS